MSGVGFWVIGLPAPQGSKRHLGNGVLVESSKKVKPWRQDVTAAALAARTPQVPLDGPLALVVCFTLPRPKSAPKRRLWPDRTPDLSKLVRSTEDAITTAGLWADDARVVSCDAAKRYVGDPKALPVPGAVIGLGPIDHQPPHEGIARTAYHQALHGALATLTPKETA